MNLDYLKTVWQRIGSPGNFEDWVEKTKNNEDHISKIHSIVGAGQDINAWKANTFGTGDDETPGGVSFNFGEPPPPLVTEDISNNIKQIFEKKDKRGDGMGAEKYVARNLQTLLTANFDGNWKVEEVYAGYDAVKVTNPHGEKKIFEVPRPFGPVATKSGASTYEDVVDWINENNKPSEEKKKQKTDIYNTVWENYMTDNKVNELHKKWSTLEDLELRTVKTPYKRIQKLIRQDMQEGNLLGPDGKSLEFTELSKSEISDVISDVFYAKLESKAKVKRDELLVSGLEHANITDQNSYNDYKTITTGNDIKTITNPHQRSIAESLNKIRYGNLNDVDKEKEWANIQAKKLILGKEKKSAIFDINSGLIQSRNVDKIDVGEGGGYENVEEDVELFIDTFSSLFTKNESGFLGALESKYFQNKLQKAEMIRRLEEVNKYRHGYGKDEARETGEFSLKDVIYHDEFFKEGGKAHLIHRDPVPLDANGNPTMSERDFENYRQRLKQEWRDILVEEEALRRMYLLNESPLATKKRHLSTTARSAYGSIFGAGKTEDRFGPSERQIIDVKSDMMNEVGIPMDEDELDYIRRGTGEQINEAVAGSAGILIQFFMANKAQAYLQSAKLLRGGKTINSWLKAKNAKRYYKPGNRKKSWNAQQIIAKKNKYNLVKFGKDKSKYISAGNYNKTILKATETMRASTINRLQSLLYTSVAEGVKFKVIGGDFVTGFGFGMAGKILSPLMGFVKGNPRLKSLLKYGVHSPLSFTVGSEVGELMRGLADDIGNFEDFSTFLKHEYADYSQVGQRAIVNWVTGTTFGLTHINKYDFKSLPQWKQLRTDAAKNIKRLVKAGYTQEVKVNKKGEMEYTGNILVKGKKATQKQKERWDKHKEMLEIAESKIFSIDATKAEYDPILRHDAVSKSYEKQEKYWKEKGFKVTYEFLEGEQVYKDYTWKEWSRKKSVTDFKDFANKKIKIVINMNNHQVGVAGHEMGHAGFAMEFGTNAVFTGKFFKGLRDIARTQYLKDGKSLDKALQEKKVEKKWSKSELHEEYLFHLAEILSKEGNLKALDKNNAWGKLANFIQGHGKKKFGHDYNFQLKEDIVRWFGDYIESVNKGYNTIKQLSHLRQVINKQSIAEDAKLKRAYEADRASDILTKEVLEVLDKRIPYDQLKKQVRDVYIKDIKPAIDKGTSKEQAFKILSDPVKNYDPFYPLVGDKMGRLMDMAMQSYNTRLKKADVPVEKHIQNIKSQRFYKKDGTTLSDRAEIVVQILSDKRALPDIIKRYDASKGELATWIVGELSTRMQEIKGRTVLDASEANRLAKEGFYKKSGDISENIDVINKSNPGEGYLHKTAEAELIGKEPEGIQLRDYKFITSDGKTKTIEKISPESIKNIEKLSKDIFKNTDIKDLTYAKIAEKMKDIVAKEIEKIMGVTSEMKKPGEKAPVQKRFITDNAKILYESMPDFSNPKFYENTLIGKTALKKFYRKTGEKFKSNELSVEEAKRTDARAEKYEKIEPTQKQLESFVDHFVKTRDNVVAGERIKPLKEHIGKVLGNQIFRDLMNNKTFQNEISKTADGKAKLENLKLGLAFRKLKGAVPKELASDILEEMSMFQEWFRNVDFAKAKFVPQMIQEKMKEFKNLSEYIENVPLWLAESGFKLEGVDLKTFKTYNEALRLFDQKVTGEVKPAMFKNWNDIVLVKELNKIIEKIDPEGVINFNEAVTGKNGWTRNKNKVKKVDDMFKEILNDMFPEFKDMPMMHEFMGANLGVSKGALGGEYRGKTWITSFTKGIKGKGKIEPPKNEKGEIIYWEPGSGKRMSLWEALQHYKITDNKTFKEKVNKILNLPQFKNIKNSTKQQDLFVEYINNGYKPAKGRKTTGLLRENSSFEKLVEANEVILEYVTGKLFDYVKKAPNKASAIQNVFRVLRLQTNIGKGPMRGLATHDAVSIRKGIKHSEHEFQLFNFSANTIYNMISNMGSKKAFQNNMRPIIEIYKQSIIPDNLRIKYDSKPYGGKRSHDFIYTTDAGKFAWMRDLVTAETTIDLRTGKTFARLMSETIGAKRKFDILEKQKADIINKTLKTERFSEDLSSTEKVKAMQTIDSAIAKARQRVKDKNGMSTFDFDETLIIKGKNFVVAREPNTGKKVKISSAKWPIEGPKYAEQGYTFDFKDFVNVRGGTEGPLLQKMKNQIKKYGVDNVFVLTARPPESATAIYGWLKSKGIDIPIKNITGLGNSTGEAKAMWMLEKFSEGYNDMYFVDDALPNVKAVRRVLDQLDIKSKVRQVRFSDDLNLEFNKILEDVTGIKAKKTISGAKAKVMGQSKWSKSFVVAGAQDFMGLMQNFMGKGKKGDAHRKFFEDKLVEPFAKGTNTLNQAKQRVQEDFRALTKELPTVKKKLNKKLPNSPFTYDQAIRTYIWNKNKVELTDLSKKEIKQLSDFVKKDKQLKYFADQLNLVSKGKYPEPGKHWVAETIISDLQKLTEKVGRKKHLAEWIENKNIIFSEKNLDKIEATQGQRFREALEDMLYRMETGRNRPTGSNRLANAHMNFINGSVGATMFLNMRSALLQTISATNYVNWGFNNPAKAAAAFGNQKQFWTDFSYIWNSPMLKQRRAGLKYNVQEAELAAAVAGSTNKAKAAVAWLIKKGFTPTQIADSFAISSGGATYYRNAVKNFIKQGMSKRAAEKKAWLKFQEVTEKAQQSSRADLISQQQASVLGRTILAWANTPMQYMRIQEKAARNIINGRGDFKTNMSQLAYYGLVQSVIFASLQSALFAFGLDEEEDLDDKDKHERLWRVVNTVADSQLRGIGTPGALVSAIKNSIMQAHRQETQAWKPDHVRTGLELTGYSPVIGSKLKKLYGADRTIAFNRGVIAEMGLHIDNPAIDATANVIEATTNIPVARVNQKIDNLREVMDERNQWWQRVMSLLGYAKYDVGAETEAVEEAKKRIDQRKKEEKKKKSKSKKTPVRVTIFEE